MQAISSCPFGATAVWTFAEGHVGEFLPQGGSKVQLSHVSIARSICATERQILGKHRSTVRTEHRLEAYATLRRRVGCAGSRSSQDGSERLLNSPEIQ